ncbi:MAG: hypothetical protein ACI91O_000183 [Candidatus Poriferisodalaceae bacterium]|jgi:hypothetical protein
MDLTGELVTVIEVMAQHNQGLAADHGQIWVTTERPYGVARFG